MSRLQNSRVNETSVQAIDFDTLADQLSPYELKTLKDYQTLAISMDSLSKELLALNEELAATDRNESVMGLLIRLRDLETKIGLVSNLFKGSVYKIANVANSTETQSIDETY